jgi:hypothetical protein
VALTQNTSEQDLQAVAEPAILQAECNPSLKEDMRVRLREAGFSSLSDGIRTLVRDFVAGRIKYRNGVLISQAKTT